MGSIIYQSREMIYLKYAVCSLLSIITCRKVVYIENARKELDETIKNMEMK
jgi:hypothetical protein